MIDNTPLDNSLDCGLWPKSGYVQVTKLEATNDLFGMLPTAYWARGQLISPLKLGDGIRVLRDSNTDKEDSLGFFISSPIARINRLDRTTVHIHTQNSIWLLEFIAAPRFEDGQSPDVPNV